MDWLNTLAEQRIREALDRGDNDRLEGRGMPLQITRGGLPVDVWVSQTMLKAAGLRPREVELMRAGSELAAKLAEATDPEARRTLSAQLQAVRVELDLLLEQGGAPRMAHLAIQEEALRARETSDDQEGPGRS